MYTRMGAPDCMRSGLCMDIPIPQFNLESSDLLFSGPSTGHETHRTSVASLLPEISASEEQPVVIRAQSDNTHRRTSSIPLKPNFSLRSTTGMQGLLLAETGGGLVELDPLGGGSGFKQGTRVFPGLITPRGGAIGAVWLPPDRQQDGEEMLHSEVGDTTQLPSRHGTLLGQGATSEWNAAELNSLLGSSRSKIKSGAKVLLPLNLSADTCLVKEDMSTVGLEQGKSRARVEIDILLDSEVCVEGGYLTGKLSIKIKKRGNKDSPVFLAGGMMRIVGFEGIPGNNDRHIFYCYAVSLSAVSDSSQVLYTSRPDEQGFSRAREGLHIIPFAMRIPITDGNNVGAKGPFENRSGVVKYLAIASFKLKDETMSQQYIAYFYRSCEVYPYIDASIAMAPATRPLLSTAARSLFLGGTGKLKLTASLHRSVWVAGQRCCVGIAVHNESKKAVKSVILGLIRTVTVFHPHPHLDVASPSSADPDACQTTTTHKLMAETTLEAGQRGLKGRVTAKGWWTGVGPGVRSNFFHFILLPHNALSIVRSRLLEVQYAIRVSLLAGSLSSEISVMLPIRIVHYLSIDPPPSHPTFFDQLSTQAFLLPLPITNSDPTSATSASLKGIGTQKARNNGKSEGGHLAPISSGTATCDLGCPSGAPLKPLQSLRNGSGLLSPVPSSAQRLTEEDPASDPCSSVDPEYHPAAYKGRNGISGNGDDCRERGEDKNTKMNQEIVQHMLGNLNREDSDDEMNFVVGSAGIDDQSITRLTDSHIEGDETLCTHRSPVATAGYCRHSTPPMDDHLSEFMTKLPARHALGEKHIPLASCRSRVRFQTTDLFQSSCDSFVNLPKSSLLGMSPIYPLPAKSLTNRVEKTNPGEYPFSRNPPQKLTGAPPCKMSQFSQRVDRLVLTRRAGVRSPDPNMSSGGNGSTVLSSEGTSTQLDTLSTIALRGSSTSPATPNYMPPPPKVPIPSRPTSASGASSVRSRVAELEGLRQGPDVSAVSSRLPRV